jgi:hypothetical protein
MVIHEHTSTMGDLEKYWGF